MIPSRNLGIEDTEDWTVLMKKSLSLSTKPARTPRGRGLENPTGVPAAGRSRAVPRRNAVRSAPRGKAAPVCERRVRRPVTRAPQFVEPMKALGVTEVPAGRWRCEIKFDGYRALAGLEKGRPPQLWSRNANSLAEHYPEITQALKKLRCRDALIDGEIVALDAEGRSHFQLLQQREAAEARPPIYYYVFDLLQLNGFSLVDQPLEVRRQALEKLVGGAPDIIRLSATFEVPPEHLLKEAARLGLEGIIAKRAGSLYEIGRRSGTWLKCKISSEQEFVIGGYTPPEGSRRHIGALLVGYYQDGKLMYAGKVGTGFNARKLAELHALFQPRLAAACPFANLPATNRPRYGDPMNAAAMKQVHWLKPELVCQVRFTEWTQGGNLRHPVFVGMRKDKKAREVVREAGGADL